MDIAEILLEFGLCRISHIVQSQTTVGIDRLRTYAVLSEVVILIVHELHQRERVRTSFGTLQTVPVLQFVQL